MGLKKNLNKDQSEKVEKAERYFDYTLIFIVIFLVCFGLIMIYSTSSYSATLDYGDSFYWMKRQAGFALMGFLAMIAASRIDYHIYAKFAFLAYIVMNILQIAVLFIGKEVNGQRRWIYIGPIGIQPSEMAKMVLIVFLAYVASRSVKKLRTWKGILKVFLLSIPLVGFVAVANLSTSIVLLGISFIIVFVASNRYWPFGAVVIGAVAMMGAFLALASYRVGRITAWLNVETDPNAYQTRQSLYAIGSGGIFGKGLGQSIQKLDYLPEAHNDMIFAIISEELGLFGAISILLLFIILIWRCMIVANNAPDLFGALIVTGIMAQIGLQVIINVAVATNSIPNTGITLPFISYGGTSVVFLLFEIGMVLSVSRQIKFQR